jgi:hypothetical protein
MVFENRVLRGISRPRMDEFMGSWRKLHNEELHIFYSLLNIISVIKSRRTRWVRHVAHVEETRNQYKILVGKPEVKKPLRR